MTEPQPLLGPARVRQLAAAIDLRPTKSWGQNFVIDAGTVRKIVRAAGVTEGQHVVEVGPGLGSLTLGLLEVGAIVTAVEIDPKLATLLPRTIEEHQPTALDRLTVINQDALTVTELPEPQPTALVANLPYNVSVPVLLTFLERFDSLDRVLVMVQAEVAERLAAKPGSRIYGIPSAKAAWYTEARRTHTIGPSVFWPVPRIDSALVELVRRPQPATTATRQQVFSVVDAAFAQRRKALRGALAGIFGGTQESEAALRAVGLDPLTRGEQLGIEQFAALAEHLPSPE